jgi:RES domain-containing protein
MSGSPDLLPDFDRFLSEFPLLGLAHDAGRQIADAMRGLPRRRLELSNWFRGIEAADSKRPEPKDFFPPDPARVAIPEQRFNHQGQRVFYLSDSLRGAALECKESATGAIWVQEFAAAPMGDLIDLSSGTGNSIVREAAIFCGDVDPNIARPEHLQPQYRVPRFVADCARRHGIRALLVPSTVEGVNLVVFCWREDELAPVAEPQRISI